MLNKDKPALNNTFDITILIQSQNDKLSCVQIGLKQISLTDII